jgi:hypothetical protein
VTLTCGMVGYQPRRFIAATACAAVIWASYAFFLGRLGGQAFEDQAWLGLLLALGATLVLSAVAEVVRRGGCAGRARTGRTAGWDRPLRRRSRPAAWPATGPGPVSPARPGRAARLTASQH